MKENLLPQAFLTSLPEGRDARCNQSAEGRTIVRAARTESDNLTLPPDRLHSAITTHDRHLPCRSPI